MQSNPQLIFNDMTWMEIADAANEGTPVVVPIGATEQHGPHLPVATDWVLPMHVLRAAMVRRKFVVGPALTFGYRSRPGSGGGQGFPGTVSLRATTLMAVLHDVLSELIRSGFRNIVIYNWHYENTNFVYEPAFMIGDKNPDVKIVVIESAIPDLSRATRESLWPEGFPGLAHEHAALIETSLWLRYDPTQVRLDRMLPDSPEISVPYDVIPIDHRMTTRSGSLASPVAASAEHGELLEKELVNHFLTIMDSEFSQQASTVRD